MRMKPLQMILVGTVVVIGGAIGLYLHKDTIPDLPVVPDSTLESRAYDTSYDFPVEISPSWADMYYTVNTSLDNVVAYYRTQGAECSQVTSPYNDESWWICRGQITRGGDYQVFINIDQNTAADQTAYALYSTWS